jgi:hypothetical protein
VLITSTEEEDYAAIRPSLRSILLEQAAEFQASNAARFGINLPAGGYAINDLFASFVADMDGANFTSNYATVNVPFSLASPTRASSAAAPTSAAPSRPMYGTATGFQPKAGLRLQVPRHPRGNQLLQLHPRMVERVGERWNGTAHRP